MILDKKNNPDIFRAIESVYGILSELIYSNVDISFDLVRLENLYEKNQCKSLKSNQIKFIVSTDADSGLDSDSDFKTLISLHR